MASVHDTVQNPSATPPYRSAGSLAALIDRWIYVFMAAFLMVVTLAGFVPNSLDRIARVEAGMLPPFPMILHLHAALMGTWFALLLAQTTLMATGRDGFHRQLGLASLVIAPLIVGVGFALVPVTNHLAWDFLHRAPVLSSDKVQQTLHFQSGNLLLQLRAGIGFSLFVALALAVRRRDAGLHKRMMIMATTMPMTAAINRIFWLPTTRPESATSLLFYGLMLTLPMLAWDVARTRRVHRAYLIFFAVNLLMIAAINSLWNTPGWVRLFARLMSY